MRPLSFAERRLQPSAISLRAAFVGTAGSIDATTVLGFEDYVTEILASGFPGIRIGPERLRAAELDSYLDYAFSREVPALGAVIRRPQALREWLRAYAAASSSTATFEAIAAAVAKRARPARSTIVDYREALNQLWLLDEVPAWIPSGRHLSRLGQSPKHQLADPALAARLLRVNRSTLLAATSPAETAPRYRALRNGSLLSALFESLVTLTLRVYAQPLGAEISHLRTYRGDHEIDLILDAPGGRILAIEIKLAEAIDDADVRHLNWLSDKLGEQVIDRIIITTGRHAYRRRDGIAVVPFALLGP
jgi:predicted AAA+ superfamily ATPase